VGRKKEEEEEEDRKQDQLVYLWLQIGLQKAFKQRGRAH
jgi:hypothetical protein